MFLASGLCAASAQRSGLFARPTWLPRGFEFDIFSGTSAGAAHATFAAATKNVDPGRRETGGRDLGDSEGLERSIETQQFPLAGPIEWQVCALDEPLCR